MKPTASELAAAHGRSIADVVGENLDVLFCGINPSLYSAAVGRHFARPGNRFWPALHLAGFTPSLFSSADQHLLPSLGYGITNVVARATAAAAELETEEIRAGARSLRRRVLRLRPRVLAVLGIGAYRTGFRDKGATLGRQPEAIGTTIVWVLPNPSGLNAHYGLADLARLFESLHDGTRPRLRAATRERE